MWVYKQYCVTFIMMSLTVCDSVWCSSVMIVLLGIIPTQCSPHTSSFLSVTVAPYLRCSAPSTANSRYATSARNAVSPCAPFALLNMIHRTSPRRWSKEFSKNTGLFGLEYSSLIVCCALIGVIIVIVIVIIIPTSRTCGIRITSLQMSLQCL